MTFVIPESNYQESLILFLFLLQSFIPIHFLLLRQAIMWQTRSATSLEHEK